MPLMADGEWLTLGRVPSKEREKDEERKRVKEKTKRMKQRRVTNNPDKKKMEAVKYSTQRIGKKVFCFYNIYKDDPVLCDCSKNLVFYRAIS